MPFLEVEVLYIDRNCFFEKISMVAIHRLFFEKTSVAIIWGADLYLFWKMRSVIND